MAQSGKRLIMLDLARSLALLGMVIFHFTYDLDMFGWIPRGTAVTGWFYYHARLVAGAFLFLAGMGLWLAHGRGIRWRGFGMRFVKIAAAAALVTVVSHFAMPGMTIFYGILHSIVVASLLGLAFLRLPIWAIALAAICVFLLPHFYAEPALGGALIWLGLSGSVPLTADYEPLFPWFAPFLAGMATAKAFSRYAVWDRLALRDTALLRALAWPGRHSLAIYLIHQPVLIGLVYAVTWAYWRL